MFLISENATIVLNFIHSLHFEAFLVGGCVRDLLMKREVHDYDITTSCPAEHLLEQAKASHFHVLPTGLQHGTITFFVNHEAIEVTTYRIDTSYVDHRRPQAIQYTKSLREDLKRRDFTINAICLDQHRIIDYFGGQNDILHRQIRCIGNAEDRFEEDALRILRALRFCFTLGFQIEQNTYSAIKACAPLLTYIAKERIRDEFIKMLKSNQRDSLITLRDCGVLPYIIPELAAIYDVTQESPYHIYDVFHHTNEAFNASIAQPLAIRLAILLHDIEKPNYKTIDLHGVAHFKGHAHAGAHSAKRILQTLKFPKSLSREVYNYIYFHDYYVTPNKKVLRKFMYKLHGDYQSAYSILLVQKLDNAGKNPSIIEPKNREIDASIAVLKEMEADNEIFSIAKLAINGNDIMTLGFQDEAIGLVLHRLLNYVVQHQDENNKERLLTIAGGMKNEIFNCK